jgi:hypothetical protein
LIQELSLENQAIEKPAGMPPAAVMKAGYCLGNVRGIEGTYENC